MTITRTLVFAGCKAIKRSKVKSMTQKEFVDLGGDRRYFKAYKQMVLGAMLLVKPNAQSK